MDTATQITFWLGSTRYALCSRQQAHRTAGRVIDGSSAERLIANALRSADASQVRAAFARLQGAAFAQMDDATTTRWFSAQLGGDLTGRDFGGLALVELSDPIRAQAKPTIEQPPDTPEVQAAKEVLAQIKRHGDVDLVDRGQSYRIALAGTLNELPNRDQLEVLSVREATLLVAAMSEAPTRPAPLREALQHALALMAPAAGRARAELVVLRRLRVLTRTETKSAAKTPSQLKKEVAVDWVEVKFVDDKGKPIANEPYEAKLSDGSVQTGTLDENGMAYIAGIVAGSAEFTFTEFKPRVAS